MEDSGDDDDIRLHEEGSEPTLVFLLRRNNSFPGALSATTTNVIGRTNPAMTNFITHLTGDGSETRIVVEDPSSETSPFPKFPPPPLPPSGSAWRRTISAPNNNNAAANVNAAARPPRPCPPVQRESLKRKIIRRTLFAICIFFGQVFVSVALKRYGIIEKDLNQVMTEKFAPAALAEYMPDIHGIEMRIQETIESARLITPGFNDTLYWLRLNNQLSEIQQNDDGSSTQTQTSTSTTTTTTTTTTTAGRLRPGQKLAKKGAVGQHPIVMIPGFVTSGLEVWKGKDCMENGFFRQRVWGGWGSAQYWLRHAMCMMKNLALDPITGGDPDGIKLRSAEGFNAADFFLGNDWFAANYWYVGDYIIVQCSTRKKEEREIGVHAYHNMLKNGKLIICTCLLVSFPFVHYKGMGEDLGEFG